MAFYSATLVGVRPLAVEIEIDLSSGMPFFQIVGLPDAILRESKTRVKSAIVQSGFEFPYDQRLVLNLAPSKVRKEGSGFELALAARILASSAQIPVPPGRTLFLGELALDGSVRTVPEVEALAYASQDLRRLDRLVVANDAINELPPMPCPVVAIGHLRDLTIAGWWKSRTAQELTAKLRPVADDRSAFRSLQFSAFWARHLEIAAVGSHHYFLCGPPGCGKTFFAESLRGLMALQPHEKPVDLKVLNAIFKRSPEELPWAAPHHSVTAVGLMGGGNPPRPGAVTRAHGGLLFLDELLEFSSGVLDSLREPLEKGSIEVFRAGTAVEFPSAFQLIACTNPCRCGFWLHPLKPCSCQPHSRKIYQARMSGPFFDRFDVRILCQPTLDHEPPVSAESIVKRVGAAREFKTKCPEFAWSPQAVDFLKTENARSRMNLRAEKKIKKLALTLAALELRETVTFEDVRVALGLHKFEGLDRSC